jgi:outer membrane lipoprotein-sorting protein
LLSLLPLLICVPADDIDVLMKKLSALPGLEAKFTEEKHITLLAAPLNTEGVLRFSPPSMLSRETTRPQASRVVIVEDRLFFDDGKTSQEIDVGNNPVVRAFVNSFVLLLAGDRSGLEQLFTMKLKPGEPWELELVPKKEPISKIIAKMKVSGRGVKVEKLTVEESSGDRTETTFVEVDTQKSFSDAEKQKYFRTK